MAAVLGHYNFWNITSEQALQEAWLRLENVKPLSATSSVLSIVMTPTIVLGNLLVLLAVWKDPLKKLRSSPSNFILVSMALADLSVGLVVCPITAYWGWVIFDKNTSPFGLSVIFAINVFSVNVSFGHIFLLTVDRLFAVVTPLEYRFKITNKRVLVACCVCWMYFVAFGCSFLMFRDYFAIMVTIYNLLIYLCKPCHPHLALLMVFFGFSGTLTCANSFLNPILYSWRLPKFRETFKYFWRNRNFGRLQPTVWKDPLKKLRSSPSNFILVSMALADLSVGLVVCPITAYWGWVRFEKKTAPFGLSVIFAINVFSVNVSFGHMLLLAVDRLFAVVTPLEYRLKITNKRVLVGCCVCWMYFVAFGCSFLMLGDYFAIMVTIYNVQLLSILLSILIMYAVMMFHFHRYSKTIEKEQRHSIDSRLMILKRERNVFKAITIVICAFLICYMPWFIVQLLKYLCKPCHPHLALLIILFRFSTSLTHANSFLNPILYSWRLPKFKETLKYFWKNRNFGRWH
ncbi:unnamed protein product [Porites evermanni]|uniref:G-protein coupled receptors family 1 profile domain-containing protein n=1 Tax=Porites evermanni TaxID=104178 RepID=A0ABN8LLM7_9CNID|nr:unnamed protein product [Porites evermanni]